MLLNKTRQESAAKKMSASGVDCPGSNVSTLVGGRSSGSGPNSSRLGQAAVISSYSMHKPARPESELVKPAPPAGDKDFQALYARHWAELCNYVKKRFGAGPPDPEDIAQEAFLRYSSAENVNEIVNTRAYLYRTAHNIAIDERRRLASRNSVKLAAEQGADCGDDRTPERVLLSRERLDVLARTIRGMPPAQRRSLLLNRLHGLSCAAIARMTGYSESAVKKHIAVALTDLEAEWDSERSAERASR